ncbi:MAG: cysteine desulfurase NifS [Candidatus Brocadiales bacterium]|nr:cysteine desulfurase NifS [Candidatus Brocadiales bacterium]
MGVRYIQGFNGVKVIYFDNNATTRVADEVLEEMLPYFSEQYGNPSSIHAFGSQVQGKLTIARERVADLLGAYDPSEIIFTSCGTESNNNAIKGTLEAFPDKRHIVTTKVEHPAVLSLCKHLVEAGYQLTELNVDHDGMLDLDELRSTLRDDTAIVSIMYANNETGVIFPIEDIGKIVKERGITFHCDAVQAVGKIPINLRNSTVDLLSLSGHKLHAPKGVGALYIRKGVRLSPFIIGGHQEQGRRAGTENVPSIIGLGKACELAKKYIVEEQTKVRKLRDTLENGLLSKLPNVKVNGHKTKRLPNTSNISFEYIEGEAILLYLSEIGVAASSGSACTSGSAEPSHVLTAMGVPTAAHGSVRFSLSRYNTLDDVECVLEKVPPIVERLREISPFGKEILKSKT